MQRYFVCSAWADSGLRLHIWPHCERYGQIAWLYDLAWGHDSRPLNPDVPPLRLIRTFTLSEPVAERRILVNAVGRLSGRISQALAQHGYQAEALKLSALSVSGPKRL